MIRVAASLQAEALERIGGVPGRLHEVRRKRKTGIYFITLHPLPPPSPGWLPWFAPRLRQPPKGEERWGKGGLVAGS